MVSLVVVESPAKARTIGRMLGKQYQVEASYGHVRDLPEKADEIPARVKKEPWARLGVNVEQEFEPLYVIPNDKKKAIKRLKEALAPATELLLATDEDREGESISWHVVEVLKPKVPVRRIVFHEITEEAIREALANPRDIDQSLVRAQESRRILDRLFGYQLSPVLWKKVRTGLSAGRVQSVAVRLCVLRERERARFVTAAYWDAEARFSVDGQTFVTQLARVGDRRIAGGQDFDPDTGQMRSAAKAHWYVIAAEVEGAIAAWKTPWRVSSVEEKPFTRRPAPPFTTSSLQQEANRKLGFSARHTMRVAQRLYEGIELGGDLVGLITYMRTDSTTLAQRALSQAQQVIRQRYGDAYATGPRRYATAAKGAQEAHEAIRPTDLDRSPERVERYLPRDEARLYELIWKRTLACQMADARLRRTTVEITAPDGPGQSGIFVATGKAIEFPGFLRAYVEGSDDPSGEIADQEVVLPLLTVGQTLVPDSVEARGHETTPPARYTEASLVKKLEAEGIGRPSTYATILDTIQDRGYVSQQKNALVPTFTAVAVTQLLEQHFPHYVDVQFTARLEEQLDEIAGGETDWREYLRRFYFGDEADPGLEPQIATQQAAIEFPSIPVGPHPESGNEIVVKVGRWGPYLQVEKGDGERLSATLPEDLAPADLDVDQAMELLHQAEHGARVVGHDEGGETVYLARGRFGSYVQLGELVDGGPKPKRASLPKGLADEEVTLALALKLLSLPRGLGRHPESGEEVIAARGRFGPFVRCGDETRSIRGDDDVYEIGLDRALELLAQPKGGRRRGQGRIVLREFGPDASGAAVQLVEGPYGPYLSNGALNASIPKGQDPASLDLAGASALLASRGKPPRRGGARRKR